MAISTMTFHVDDDIQRCVELMNQLGFVTFSSCDGQGASSVDGRPFISFKSTVNIKHHTSPSIVEFSALVCWYTEAITEIRGREYCIRLPHKEQIPKLEKLLTFLVQEHAVTKKDTCDTHTEPESPPTVAEQSSE